MVVKIDDKLGRETHTSQSSDFNVLYGSSVARSISKLNEGKPASQKHMQHSFWAGILSLDKFLSKVRKACKHYYGGRGLS